MIGERSQDLPRNPVSCTRNVAKIFPETRFLRSGDFPSGREGRSLLCLSMAQISGVIYDWRYMISLLQDVALFFLDRILGDDDTATLDRLEQSASPQLRRLGEVLSTLEPLPAPPRPAPPPMPITPRSPVISPRAILAEPMPSFDLHPPLTEPSQSPPARLPIPSPVADPPPAIAPVALPASTGATARPMLQSEPSPPPDPDPRSPLADLSAIIQAWQAEITTLQHQRQAICAEGPAFGGWLEAEQGADGVAQYRLCSIHESGRLLSEPCPLAQVGEIRKAIARYHRQHHLLIRQQQLQYRLDLLLGMVQWLANAHTPKP
jgi:hypothetical protein